MTICWRALLSTAVQFQNKFSKYGQSFKNCNFRNKTNVYRINSNNFLIKWESWYKFLFFWHSSSFFFISENIFYDKKKFGQIAIEKLAFDARNDSLYRITKNLIMIVLSLSMTKKGHEMVLIDVFICRHMKN